MTILVSKNNNNKILNSIKYLLNQEMIKYEVRNTILKRDDNDKIIYIMEDEEKIKDVNSDLLFISKNKIDLKKFKNKTNLIITNLINDKMDYTKAQEEYLFRKGIYNVISNIALDFLNNHTANKVVYDTSFLDPTPVDWTFDFESTNESYAWLSRKNRNLVGVRKVIETYNPKIFNDSDKEIDLLNPRK